MCPFCAQSQLVYSVNEGLLGFSYSGLIFLLFKIFPIIILGAAPSVIFNYFASVHLSNKIKMEAEKKRTLANDGAPADCTPVEAPVLIIVVEERILAEVQQRF